MEKNVSGVDLEELKKAREELDRERGMESDPDMYSDYNPNREELQLENSVDSSEFDNEKLDENSPSSEQNNEIEEEPEGKSEENLSKFGAFSAFEVKDEGANASKSVVAEPQKESETDEKNNEIDSLLNELISDYEENSEEEKKEDNVEDDGEAKEQETFNSEFNTSIDIEPNFEENENEISDASGESEILIDTQNENIDKENESQENEYQQETEVPVQNGEENLDIITDFNQLKEILQNELKESEEAEKERIAQPEEKIINSKYPIIEDFKFINEITTEEFKNTDSLSYIMGKNENGETVFGNFKEHCNLAVFGKNDLVINSFLNSMILSLSLKNNYHDVNFVLLDSNIDSSFEVYNKSSYLYFNRIAKTNKEIADTLIEVAKEIDNRYDKIAELGMKNVEEYNEGAIAGGFSKLPYVVVVFNNYTSASQATNNDKINTCLYQTLKFGRNVGIYCVVTAKLPIETNQVNYNLSSRVSFKSDTESMYTIGESGVTGLPEESDALYYNISNGKVIRIKSATVSDTELDLIIKDLED